MTRGPLRALAPRRREASQQTQSRVAMSDLLAESLAGILQRPARTLLTALGTVLGVGAFVAVLGITATASGQISARFTALIATEIQVKDNGDSDASQFEISFPDDSDERVRAIPGVEHAGVLWQVAGTRVSGVVLPGGQPLEDVSVRAASADVLRAIGPTIKEGRLYDEFHDSRAEQVAVLGSAAARRLGVTTLTLRPSILIDNIPFSVIGIVSEVERRTELLFDVLVPRMTARQLWGPPNASAPAEMLVVTRVGAAQVVAEQIALALRPDRPDLFTVVPPPDPRALRNAVSTDLAALFLVLAGVCLVVGAVGIANTTMVAVLERTQEIGLRRALGARRRHIAGQFLGEAATVGCAGGMAGASLGLLLVVVVAFVQHWTPIIASWTLVAAPLLGAGVGLVAGLYPAIRAAQVEPVEALRR